MTKDILKILQSDNVDPTPECLNAFNEKFSGSVGLEWHANKSNFEAIFYKDNLEHIALFSPDGQLIEYRRFVPEGNLPLGIRQQVLEKGEIMNRVLLNRGNEIFYEVIYRDQQKQRYMLLLTDLGNIIEHKKL
ncbi:hypothetical protein [Fulvivirga sp.]|uniref:hypothetical protein n=1 Tax=Fulvivirga sp. TaxID=1931237 RepID=UPI0032ECCC64